jgi:hypothetical protein
MRLCRRRKPVDEVMELIHRVKEKYNMFTFLDSNLYSDPDFLKELFEKLKPLKIKWLAASTLELGEDEDLLSKAKEAGCLLLSRFFSDSVLKSKG